MNKTLLLIICDFLLLNLLALTRWDKVEPAATRKPPVPEVSANAARQNQDLVDMMKLALEQEQATRNQLQQRLQFAESDSQSRAQTLVQLQAQKSQLETNLKQSQTAAQDLSQRYAAVAKQAADAKQQQDALTAAIKNVEAEKAQMQQTVAAKQAEIQKQQVAIADLGKQQAATAQQASNLATTVRVVQAEKDLVREQLEKQMQAALAAKQVELEKQQKALVELEKQRQAVAAQAAQFATAAKVAESERNLLRENLTDLKKEVAVVRQEKEMLQSQTARLSEGVGQLAAKSGELAKEIRENTPINMNLMFSEFLSNRVDVAVSAQQNVLLGSGNRLKEVKSVLVHDGRTVMAIVHVTDTPFSLTTPLGMDRVIARVAKPPQVLGSGALTFITADPRLAVIPVNAQQALGMGVKMYPVAKNPFKFTEAVLVNRGGRHYGEVEFKLNAATPGYVKMRNRILSRVLQGEFSPSTGDIVLSKTGEFLGVMVNPDYCAVLQTFETLPGYTFDEKTTTDMVRNRLVELQTRVGRLPFSLQ
ncbi:MAG: hypothetical protein FD161_2332 [Limisphaerales bacterium]|nr:MAG: hypothetical protein FD161_2332 [Limisphaerales bacterium]TXT50077.1 MAG: hypothetical protein FD140_2635 [Limisphaerales bacterium]